MNGLPVLISLLGFFLALRFIRRELHPAFYPAVTVSLISAALCAGGLLGVLPQAAGALLWLGIACFAGFGVPFLRKDLKNRNGREIRPFVWMMGSFCALCALAAVLLRGHFLYSYDDFSHWGLAARVLLSEDRLPLPEDGMMFPSYPPGTACFLYFCGKAAGDAGETLLLSQAVMLLSFLMALQAAPGDGWAGRTLITLLIPLFWFYTTPLDTLSVDNLLGASFLAAALLLLKHREETGKHGGELGLILSCCTLIKNSGLFLSLGMLGLILIRVFRRKTKLSFGLAGLLLPLLAYLFWRVHLKLTFTDYGKHFMSLSVYYGTLRSRLGDLGSIFSVLLPVAFSPMKNHALWLLPALLCLGLALPRAERSRVQPVLRLGALALLLYDAGILAMYFCSMEIGEILAQNGGDFIRYNGTMICALAGVLLFCGAKTAPAVFREGGAKNRALLVLAAGFLALALGMNMTRLAPLEEEYRDFPDAWAFADTLRGGEIPKDREVTVLLNAPEATGYHEYMADYYLRGGRGFRLLGAASAPNEEAGADGTVLLDLREHRIRMN